MIADYEINARNFAQLLEKELVRLTAKGWTREQLAKDLGYTARQMQNWRTNPPPWALQVGVLTILDGLESGPRNRTQPNVKDEPLRSGE